MRRGTFEFALLAVALVPSLARAGGFEFPDNGTEALGRGGAFVAKADDGTAIYYNVGGLAQQRGTRVLIDVNLIYHDLAFTRAGNYPVDPSQSWSGKPYETIHDGDSIFFAPFISASTDFGQAHLGPLGHFVVALGLFGPSSVGQHNYGYQGGPMGASAMVKNAAGMMVPDETAQVKLADGTYAPAPSRYALTQTNLLTIFPTLALALQPVKYIDIGIAPQLVYTNLNLSGANLTPLGPGTCVGSPENPACDAYGHPSASGLTGTALFSILAHPTGWLDIGITYRPEIYIHTTGTLSSQSPAGQMSFPDSTVTFDTKMPQYVRFGARVVKHYLDGTERADLEVDGTWENWSNELPCSSDANASLGCDHLHAVAGGNGNFLWQSDAAGNSILDLYLVHHLKDTGSIRIGGAYNFRISDFIRVTPRLGFYFDSASTNYANTNIDFDTIAKYGFTVGLGFKFRGFTINLADAYVYSPTRIVTDSDILAPTANNGSVLGPRDPHVVIGNGTYVATLNIFSVGVSINFDEFKADKLFVH